MDIFNDTSGQLPAASGETKSGQPKHKLILKALTHQADGHMSGVAGAIGEHRAGLVGAASPAQLALLACRPIAHGETASARRNHSDQKVRSVGSLSLCLLVFSPLPLQQCHLQHVIRHVLD